MNEFQSLNFENLKAVSEIEKKCFKSECWSENLLADEISDDSKKYFVCLTENVVSGFGGYARILDEGHIMNIAVDDKYRRQGIATEILNKIIEDGFKKGIKAFTLEVRKSNIGAIRLYEKAGFKSAGIRPHYYPDKEDACIYWLYL